MTMRGGSPEAAQGKVTLVASVGEELEVDTVIFQLNGEVRCLTNMRPYTWDWNTAVYDPGEYVIRVVVTSRDGEEIAQREVSVIVAPAASGAQPG